MDLFGITLVLLLVKIITDNFKIDLSIIKKGKKTKTKRYDDEEDDNDDTESIPKTKKKKEDNPMPSIGDIEKGNYGSPSNIQEKQIKVSGSSYGDERLNNV